MARAQSNAASTRVSARVSARLRSETLLRDLLGADEYACLMQRGYLDVRSRNHPDRAYRIPRDGGFVTLVEQGHTLELLCIGSTEPLPPADVVVLHKLLIEADEETYLRTANHLAPEFSDWRIARGRIRLALSPWQDW